MRKEIKLAVLDLGSNSVRMEIYRIFPDGSYESVRQEKRLVRLSEKMGPEKTLKEIPIRRTLDALKEFKRILMEVSADEVRALATEAVRRARNGDRVLRQIQKETGFRFRVISGREEAAYDCLGVAFSLQMDHYMMIDTGGGSVEIALVEHGKMRYAVSLPFGSVVLSEKWQLKGRPSAEQCFNVMLDVSKAIQQVPWLLEGKELPIVMLGGSNRMLGRVHMLEHEPERKNLHNYRMSAEEIFRMYRTFLQTNTEERKAIPGIEADRADIIIGGLTPLVVLILYLESKETTVCLEGLRMGVFQEFYQELKQRGFFIA